MKLLKHLVHNFTNRKSEKMERKIKLKIKIFLNKRYEIKTYIAKSKRYV
jgi:hypothetical protein